MKIRISANILFELNVLHHYFLNKGLQNFESMNNEEKLKQLNQYHVLNFMEIVPTPDCLLQIKNYKQKYVPTPSGFIIAAIADPENENKPFLSPDEAMKLTFILKLKDNSFFNFSDLDLDIPRNKIFYFNNLEKVDSDNMSLSKSGPTGSPSLKYTGEDDLIKFYNSIHNHSIQSVGGSVQLTLTNIHGEEVLSENVDLTGGIKTYQIDLRRFPSGKYTLKEDDGSGFTEEFYLNNNTFVPGIFGLAELFGETTEQNDYAPLTAAGEFKSSPPAYHIRINNRSTIWKYIFGKDQTLGVDANVIFDKEDDGLTDNQKILLTNANQPLTSNGLIEIKKGNEAKDKLPNPDVKMIKPDATDDTKIFSETYL
jgi:hypothetical protein